MSGLLPSIISNTGTLSGVYDRIAQLARRVRSLETRGTPDSTVLTFSNGWRQYLGGSAFGVPTAYRDVGGFIHLEGLLDKNGGNWVASEVMSTLPVGFRPKVRIIAHIYVNTFNSDARIDVDTNGQVLMMVGGTSNPVGYLNLSGISFRAV